MAGDGVEVGTAYVSLLVSGDKVGPGIRRALGAAEPDAERAGRSAGKRYGGALTTSAKAVLGAAGGLFAATKVISFGADALEEAREAQVVGRRTENVIRRMGGASKVTARQVGDLSEALSNKSGVDDEAIQSGANLLLTFGNVRNEAGEGNKIFDRTTRLMVDMSKAMGQDMSSSAIQLGKALNDPVKGVSALSRVGVSFTQQQKDQIKALTEAGDALGAQKIILGEVQKQFGGAAKSMVTPADRARVAYGNLKEQIGTELLPVAEDLANYFTNEAIPAVSQFLDEMKTGKGRGGQAADLFRSIKDNTEKAAGFAGDIVSAFNDMPDWAKKALAGGVAGSFAVGKVGGAIRDRQANALLAKGGTPVNPLYVNVVNGAGGSGGGPKGKGGSVGPLGSALAGTGLTLIAENIGNPGGPFSELEKAKALIPELKGLLGTGFDRSAGGLLSAVAKLDNVMSARVTGDGASGFGAFQRIADRTNLSLEDLGALLPRTRDKINEVGGRAAYAKQNTENWRTTILGTSDQLDRLDADINDTIGRLRSLNRELDAAAQTRTARLRIAVESGGYGHPGLQAGDGPLAAQRRGTTVNVYGDIRPNDYNDVHREFRRRSTQREMGGD